MFSSFVPAKTALGGEDIQLDESNHITITDFGFTNTAEDPSLALDVIVISYDWTNQSQKSVVGSEQYLLTAKQDGVLLEPFLSVVEDKTKLVTQLGPGETLNGIQQAFVLRDQTNDVKLYLKGNANTILVEGSPQSSYPVEVTLALK